MNVPTYGAWTSLELQRWSMAANINKNLTFHSFRHNNFYSSLKTSNL